MLFGMVVEETNLGVLFESELLKVPSWMEQLDGSRQTQGLTPTPRPQVSQGEQREEKGAKHSALRTSVIHYSLNL